jgi:hypothetical protein
MSDHDKNLSIDGPQPVAAPYKLYDHRAVFVATLFGSPLAGSIFMALNYRRLGKARAAVTILIVGILLTWLGIAAGSAIPGQSLILPILLVGGMMYLAKALQGDSVEEHVRLGGRVGSRWIAFGVGLAVGVVVVLIMFGFAYVAQPKVIVGTKDEVYYSGAATEKDAKALGEALKADGFFQDRGVTVLLSKGTDGVTVSFVVKDGFWDDPEHLSAFGEMGRMVAPAIGGLPIKVRLLDSSLNMKKEVTVK